MVEEDSLQMIKAKKALELDERVNQGGFKKVLHDYFSSKGLIPVELDQIMNEGWEHLVKYSNLLLILEAIPHSDEEPKALPGVAARMLKTKVDRSNLLKDLKILKEYAFVDEYVVDGVKKYKISPPGEYYLQHAGPLLFPRTEYQKALINAQREIIELRNRLQRLEGKS